MHRLRVVRPEPPLSRTLAAHLRSYPWNLWMRRVVATIGMTSVTLALALTGGDVDARSSGLGRSPAVVSVTASVETEPVPSSGDAADDAALWIDHHRPGRSIVIATDKDGGLAVYALDGSELQYDDGVTPNNVDLRAGFPLGGQRVALVAFGDVGDGTIGTFTVDPRTRTVHDVSGAPIETGVAPVGFCLYHSRTTGRFYAFVVDPEDGSIEQWSLADDGTGGVEGQLVRSFSTGSNSEGCVADDRNGSFYVSEQSVGVWRYGAEPDAGDEAVLVDAVGDGGHLTEDVEGLAIYRTPHGHGYLIASSQGADDFQVYGRIDGRYVGTFEIVEGTVDAVSNTDGIDVTSVPLGPRFPGGLFVAQDGDNGDGNQDFKLVPWASIARAFDPPLNEAGR